MPHISITRRQMIAGTGACLVAAAVRRSAFAADPVEYFVSPHGADTPECGSSARPFLTLAYAASRVTATGNTIRLLPGSYRGTSPVALSPGVSVTGAGADKTLLLGSHEGALLDLVDGNGGGQTLSGFKIDGSDKKLTYGINIERSGVAVRQIAVENTLAAGISIRSKAVLTGIEVRDCNLKNCAHFDGSQHTGSIWIWNLDRCDFFNNTIFESDGYGIKAVGSDGDMRRCQFYRNNIETNVVHRIQGWGAIGIEIWNVAERVLVYENKVKGGISLTGEGRKESEDRTVIMHDNLVDLRGMDSSGFEIHNNTDAEFYCNVVIHPNGAGAFMVLDGGNGTPNRPSDRNLHIHHNVILHGLVQDDPDISRRDHVGHVGIWFLLEQTCTDVFVYNNLFYGTSTGIDFSRGKADNVHVINNIFIGRQNAIKFSDGTASRLVVKNNVFWKEANISPDEKDKAKIPADAQVDGNFVNQDPGLRLAGDPLSLDYYAPSSKSSFVAGRGMEVGSPIKEKTPNIGAVGP